MNMNKYLTFNTEWKKCKGEDEDTRMLEYEKAVTIKCFKYGKNIFLRGENSGTTVSAQAYLVLEEVKPKDILDGQVVKSVNIYPESWDNKVKLYEVLTWND